MAIVGMLIFLALTIKGVYDLGIDHKCAEAQYVRFNFLCAVIDSTILIVIQRVHTRLIHQLGTLAALYFVLIMVQMACSCYILDYSKGITETNTPEIHLMLFLFQLLGFQIYQSFFNVNYVAAQFLVVPAFYLSVLIVHAWILPPLPGILMYMMMCTTFIYSCFMWVGTYESYMRHIELFLSRH